MSLYEELRDDSIKTLYVIKEECKNIQTILDNKEEFDKSLDKMYYLFTQIERNIIEMGKQKEIESCQ